jgi:hypothetical protein
MKNNLWKKRKWGVGTGCAYVFLFVNYTWITVSLQANWETLYLFLVTIYT